VKYKTIKWSACALWAALPTSILEAQECEPTCADAEPGAVAAEKQIEVRANTFTRSTQHNGSLDLDGSGRALVAWGSRRQEAGSYGIFAQLFDALGRPIGTELHVNDYMPAAQVEPAVAFTADGSAWVAWCSFGGQDGHQAGIFMRRMGTDAAGSFTALGSEVGVNGSKMGDQVDPTLTILPTGQIVVAWLSDLEQGNATMARVFTADGSPLGEEFKLSNSHSGNEALPGIAALANGFVATWSRTAADGDTPSGIYARIYGADGAAKGNEFALHEGIDLMPVEPSIDSNRSDQFAVAWMSLDSAHRYQVRARRFDAQGNAVGQSWTQTAEGPEFQNAATVAMAPNGDYTVLFNRHGEAVRQTERAAERQAMIWRQDFTTAGQPIGERAICTGDSASRRNLQVGLNSRHAVRNDLGMLAYSWNGSIEDDGNAVGLTLHVPQSLQIEAPAPVERVAALQGLTLAQVEDQLAPPDWDPNWVDDSYAPAKGPSGPDFGFRAFTSTGWNPPDPDLAVGPNHIVAVVNVDMRFFTKDGTQTFNTALEPWFGTTGFVFDPVALYDAAVNRFVVVAIEHDGNVDLINIAISDDDDPNGTWYKYRFNVDSICGFIDFENLGSSADAYFVSADCFGGQGNYIHVMDKAAMLNGNPVTLQSIQANTALSSNGATKNYDNEIGYFTSAWTLGSPKLKIYAITDPAGTATLEKVNLNVGAWSSPPGAKQLGSSNRVATIDTRIKNGVVRDGFLYLTHNVGNAGVCQVRWYKIRLNGWPTSGNRPSLEDSGYVDPGSGIYTWFGDINVDAAGNMAIAYNRSSTSEYVGIYRTWRAAADAPGTLRDHVEMQTSTSPETGSRWGDYSGLEEDPANPGTFWNHHEYRTSSWRTWVGEFAIGAGSNYDLTLTLGGPLVAGTTATVTGSVWTNQVYLYNGTGPGTTTLPGLGVDLEIANGKKIMTRTANAAGEAAFSKSLPMSLAGLTVYLQAVDDFASLSPVVVDTIL
jgi:hypothetical protein